MKALHIRRDGKGTFRRTAFNAWIAACAAAILALLAGFRSPAMLIFLSLAAWGLTWILFLLRKAFAGASAMTLDTDGITFTVRNKQTTFAWPAIALASLQSVNDTPWLVVTPHTGSRRMFCLESFDPASVQAIMDALQDWLPGRFEVEETWILANRLPITVRKQPGNNV